jgi:hypothetical protein
MIRTIIILLAILWGVFPHVNAQQIRVEDFVRLKKPFLGTKTYQTDKQYVLLDLYTQESGFEFLLGKQPIEVQEGDGFLTLTLPDKTRHFTIKHPNYGQLIWKAPEELRRKKHYQAYLFTDSPDKEYKVEKQWVVFYIQPQQAIVTIDSTMYRTMDGIIQAYLPLGKHQLKVEAPFYEAMEDNILLEEDKRLEKRIHLQPFYSFLSVESHYPTAEIRLNGELIGIQQAQSKRLLPGIYELSVRQDSFMLYQETIELAAAERKVIDLKAIIAPSMISPSDPATEMTTEVKGSFQPMIIQPPILHSDSLFIQAFDKESEIWINRELMAKGYWKGELPPGVHAISTRKEGVESPTQYIRIGDGKRQHLKMSTPYAKYGWINISSNEVDAEVWLDGKLAGKTPCILAPLPTYKSYILKLRKEGYKEVETTISLKDNDMQNIYLELKEQ